MPTHAAPPRDPRSIITPDAFELSPELLGMPLATPMKRFWAIMIDLLVIGVLTVLTKSFALVLGVVAAVFFIRVSFKRTEVPNSAFGRAMRLSLGCLGLFIGVVTAISWVVWSSSHIPRGRGADRDTDAQVAQAVQDDAGAVIGLGDLLSGWGEVREFRRAQTRDEAFDAAVRLARHGREAGLRDQDIRDILTDGAPATAPWSDSIGDLVDQALKESSTEIAADTAEEERAALTLLDSLAGDTIRSLSGRIASLERDVVQGEQQIRSLRERAQKAESGGGLFGWIQGIVNELGFGFGWGSLYLTIMLSWWKGQTLGKRLMGIRVLRLDGNPITWWTAFERAGGYAAGFATGLLGFAQVYWDANRQAIHDRIVGTVVVLDGAPKVKDWERAL